MAKAVFHAPRQPQAIENSQVGKSWQSASGERQKAAQERYGAEGVGGKPSGGVQTTSLLAGGCFQQWLCNGLK